MSVVSHINRSSTHQIDPKLSTRMTDTLDNLLHFDDESSMEDGFSKLDVPEMTRTIRHSFLTGLTFEGSVDGSGSVNKH